MSLLQAHSSPALVLRPGWGPLEAARPALARTARRYLAQVQISARPNTLDKNDEVLLGFCAYLAREHRDVESFADVGRHEVESYKAYLAARGTPWGTPLKANTLRVHLSLLRVFFERMVEWRWPDAPGFTPLFRTDLPKVPRPLPKALDDAAAAHLLAAAAADTNRCRQLCVEVLARTGVRVGELCALAKDAVSRRSGSWWLRVPVGKLRNDRYVPLHPRLVELIAAWQAHHDDHGTGLLITHNGRPLQRYLVARWVDQLAKAAGVGHVHPHQLRHTLATQAVNRGMHLEAVAELLGHQNLNMTLVYARVANRTVADQFGAVVDQVDCLYAESEDDAETSAMAELRREHRRLLANGWCTRPKQLGCAFEAICEGCGFFSTGPEFLPILRKQRDHASAHGQVAREDIYERLVAQTEEGQ